MPWGGHSPLRPSVSPPCSMIPSQGGCEHWTRFPMRSLWHLRGHISVPSPLCRQCHSLSSLKIPAAHGGHSRPVPQRSRAPKCSRSGKASPNSTSHPCLVSPPITPAYPYQRGGLYTLPLPPSRPSPRSSIRPPETALSWPATATSRTQRPRARLPSPRASPTDSFIHRHTQEAAGDPAKRRTRHTPGPHGAALLPPALRPGAADAAAAPPTRPPASPSSRP